MNNEERFEIASKYVTEEYLKKNLENCYLSGYVKKDLYEKLTKTSIEQKKKKVYKNLYNNKIVKDYYIISNYTFEKGTISLYRYINEIDTYIFYFYDANFEKNTKFVNAIFVYPDTTIAYYNNNKIKNETVCSRQVRDGYKYEAEYYKHLPYDIKAVNMLKFLKNRKHIEHTSSRNINEELEKYLPKVTQEELEKLCGNDTEAVLFSYIDNIYCFRIFSRPHVARKYHECMRSYIDSNKTYLYCKDDFDNFTDDVEKIDKKVRLKFEGILSGRYIKFDSKALRSTKFEYLEDYIRFAGKINAALLYELITNELVESLWKQGFRNIAYRYSVDNDYLGQLNEDGKTFYQKLGVNKYQWEKISPLLESGNYILNRIKQFMYTSKINNLSNEQFDYLLYLYNNKYWDLEKLSKSVSTETMLLSFNTIKKLYQYCMCDAITTYIDYLHMICELNLQDTFKINFDTIDELLQMHDAITAVYNAKKNAIKAEGFKKRANTWKKFEYEGKDFVVVSPTKPEDIAYEGEKLHHCVKSYIDNVSQGETNIVFIRKKNEPNKPFFTVEIDNYSNIRQIHGFANKDANKEEGITQFVEEWAKERKLNCTI